MLSAHTSNTPALLSNPRHALPNQISQVALLHQFICSRTPSPAMVLDHLRTGVGGQPGGSNDNVGSDGQECVGHLALDAATATGGGGLRSAIYRNLPQFYRNFSVMPLFKNFNFPLRKNLSLSLLSLGTLYVSVFSSVLHIICVAGRFSVFVFPKCHLLLGTVILARAKGQ